MANYVKVNKGQAPTLPAHAKPKVAGVIPAPDVFREKAKGSRFILTTAQNNTKVHRGFWKALQAFAAHKGAEIMVSCITYNKNGFQNATKKGKHSGSDELWFADEIVPYIKNDSVQLCKGIVFSAELDILPTAKDPLSGLDNYTGTLSMVVPHPKVHMRSYAGLYTGQPLRFGYTTGACTLRNYIDRRAGQIASYHHVYGALYVEVSSTGEWFARQLIADDTGAFFDVDLFVHPVLGVVGHRDKLVTDLYGQSDSAINLGDVHAEKLEASNLIPALDLLKTISPSRVFIHDLLDFEARNHHNVKDPFFIANQHFNGMNSVAKNFEHAVAIMEDIQNVARDAKMVIIRSNHDMAFDKWLREFDGTRDPANASFFHYHMWRKFSAIQNGEQYDAFEAALTDAAAKLSVSRENWVHIREDDSYVLHKIEFGLHGHLGPNGSRGSPKGYRQLGRKLNTGHTHSAGIVDGVWTAGVLASLSMGYNKGPSSWSHSHILTHPNGKRQMITQKGAEWRA